MCRKRLLDQYPFGDGKLCALAALLSAPCEASIVLFIALNETFLISSIIIS